MSKVSLIEKYNKYHAPAGSSQGGQFISGHQALAAGMNVPIPTYTPYIKPAWSLFGHIIAKLYSGTAYQTPIRMSDLSEKYMADYGVTRKDCLNSLTKVLPEIRTDQTKYITNIEFYSADNSKGAGFFNYRNRSITLDPLRTTLNKFNEGNTMPTMGDTFKFEVGRNYWLYLTADERVRFGQIVGYPNPEELRDVSWYGNAHYTKEQQEIMNRLNSVTVTSVDYYGAQNVLTSFAEYFTYINWQTGEVRNSDTLPTSVVEHATEISKW